MAIPLVLWLFNHYCYYTGRLFGLIPFRYVRETGEFKLSGSTIWYMRIIIILLAVTEPLGLIIKFSNNLPAIGVKTIVRIIAVISTITTYFVLLISYYSQLYHRNEIILLLMEGEELRKSVLDEISGTKIKLFDKRFHRQINPRLIAYIFEVAMVLTHAIPIFIFGYEDFKNLLDAVNLLISGLSLTLLCSVLYVVLCCVWQFYNCIVKRIQCILDELDVLELEWETIKIKPGRRIQMHASLSDDIDRLAILYHRITKFVEHFNRIFGLQMTAWIFGCYISVISLSFFFYWNINALLVGIVNSDLEQIVLLGGFFSYSTELYFTVRAGARLEEMTAKISDALQCKLYTNIDIRLERSIETFSLQLLHQKIRLSACGLFNVNNTVLASIIAAAISYLIILIQFERSDPTKLILYTQK